MSNDINMPRKKRPKLTTFTFIEKRIVMNMYKHVKQTYPLDPFAYKTEIIKKTADILGISIASVYNVLGEDKTDEGIKPPPLTQEKPRYHLKVDDFDKCAIRKKINTFYLNGELPTITKVLQTVNDDVALPNFNEPNLRLTMKHLHFKFIKRQRIEAAIDSDNIILWRRSYLNKIKEYREQKRQIFYIGVTCMITVQTSPDKDIEKYYLFESQSTSGSNLEQNLERTKSERTKFRQLIILHIGNENGFVEGGEKVIEYRNPRDYHKLLDPSHFEQWLENILPKLGGNAVVVMDKAPYCSRLIENIPNTTWKREDVANWLQTKNISYNHDDVKIELLEKVKNFKDIFKQYAVDELAKKFDTEVLWLPPYHYDLNPIEFVLADVQGNVDFNINSKYEEIIVQLAKEFRQVTSEKWKNYMDRVISEEENFYNKIDEVIDRTIDTFFIGASDSETESAESSDVEVEIGRN